MTNNLVAFFFNFLSTREWAIILWFLILICFSKTIPQFYQVIKTCFKILTCPQVLLLILYLSSICFILYSKDLWSYLYLKDTILWFLFTGILLCNYQGDPNNVFGDIKNIFLNNFKILIFLELIINTYTFNFLIEFSVIIPVVFILAIFNIITEKNNELMPIKKLFDGINIFLGIGVLIFFIDLIYIHCNEILSKFFILQIALPIVFTLCFIPLAFIVRFFSAYKYEYKRVFYNSQIPKFTILYLKIKLFLFSGINFERLNNILNCLLLEDEIHTFNDVNLFLTKFIENEKRISYGPNCKGLDPNKFMYLLKNYNINVNKYNFVNYDEGYGSFYGEAHTQNMAYKLEGNNQEVNRIRLSYIKLLFEDEKNNTKNDYYNSIKLLLNEVFKSDNINGILYKIKRNETFTTKLDKFNIEASKENSFYEFIIYLDIS